MAVQNREQSHADQHAELTARLGIRHPILLAPMAAIAGSKLVTAVSNAGGFGILGGGYGDRTWLETGDR